MADALSFEPDPEVRCRDYRIGCIGAGMIMAECHLAAYKEAGFTVASIASRTKDKAQAVAARWGIPRVHDTPEALIEAVKTHQADYGIALDGDADRLQIVDAAGRLFNGDEVLYLMVKERLDRGEAVPGAVGTLMTNMAVEVALKTLGVEFVRAKVGDRYVLEELDRRGWLLGGEGSGHLLALDKHSTGDGLISALQVLQACARSGKSMVQLLADVTLFPQTLINVRLQPGQEWKSNARFCSETQVVEAELGDTGRVLIRASGTEPLLRVMVEARDPAVALSSAQRIAQTLSPT